jgi:hypothetical protein
MRLSGAQVMAGVLTFAVAAGLFLLPSRLLSHDQAVPVAVPAVQAARSVQAAPPLRLRRRHAPKPKVPTLSAPQRFTYVARARTVVQASPARRMLKAHRSAVISKLAPTAPLVRARLLAAAVTPRPRPVTQPRSSTAKTIAALAASLSKK